MRITKYILQKYGKVQVLGRMSTWPNHFHSEVKDIFSSSNTTAVEYLIWSGWKWSGGPETHGSVPTTTNQSWVSPFYLLTFVLLLLLHLDKMLLSHTISTRFSLGLVLESSEKGQHYSYVYFRLQKWLEILKLTTERIYRI
jgi:hypothetical protein